MSDGCFPVRQLAKGGAENTGLVILKEEDVVPMHYSGKYFNKCGLSTYITNPT